MENNNTYNGWSNYETWVANLWLEESLNEDMQLGYDICASHVKDTINNMVADMPKIRGLFSDLLAASIGQIDCHEISAHYQRES